MISAIASVVAQPSTRVEFCDRVGHFIDSARQADEGRSPARAQAVPLQHFGLRELVSEPGGRPESSAVDDDRVLDVLERTWRAGDRVTLELDMPVERMYAHPDVRQDAGQVAVQRGPIVYCFEEGDQPAPLQRLFLPKAAALTPAFRSNLLDGVVTLSGEGLAAGADSWQDVLYRAEEPQLQPVTLTAIPYYAWDNRAPGAMRVWLAEK
mgnify:CR=1 FL=1